MLKYLVKKKVNAERLTAKGFGQDKPISTNRTEKGRDNNRRVAFEFLDAQTAVGPMPEAPPTVAETDPPAAFPRVEDTNEPGALTVVISGGGWANVYIDGNRLTKGAPFTGQPIAAGKHEIWVANERLGIDLKKNVDVVSGETVRIEIPSQPDDKVKPPPVEDPTDDDPWGVSPTVAPAPAPTSPWGDLADEVEDVEDVDADVDEPVKAGRYGKKKK